MPIDPTSTGSVNQRDAALLTSTTASQGASSYAPQIPGLVCTGAAPWWFLGSFKVSAQQALGCRVVMPRTGILHDFAVLWNAVLAANIDAGIYSLAAEPRSRLWHSGSVPLAGAAGWQIVGDPALSVTQGQVLDLIYSLDTSNTGDVGGVFSKDVFAGDLPNGSFWPTGSGSQTIAYTVNSGMFPLPTTIADANCHRAGFVPCLVARIV